MASPSSPSPLFSRTSTSQKDIVRQRKRQQQHRDRASTSFSESSDTDEDENDDEDDENDDVMRITDEPTIPSALHEVIGLFFVFCLINID